MVRGSITSLVCGYEHVGNASISHVWLLADAFLEVVACCLLMFKYIKMKLDLASGLDDGNEGVGLFSPTRV